MVTSCAVIGCTRCHTKGVKISFYRFPRDGEKRRLWIAAQRILTDLTGFRAKLIKCAEITLPLVCHAKTPLIRTTSLPWQWGTITLTLWDNRKVGSHLVTLIGLSKEEKQGTVLLRWLLKMLNEHSFSYMCCRSEFDRSTSMQLKCSHGLLVKRFVSALNKIHKKFTK